MLDKEDQNGEESVMKTEVDELACRDITEIIPQDIYALYLTEINGIPFTQREIDIIACILSGRSAKKTASFLYISPKTVENHIRNIMLKLRCRSQETIIDLMEKSGKFIFIKRYYASLLIQAAFEQTLNTIEGIINKRSLSCKIIYPEQEHKKHLIPHLERHLKRIGIKTAFEVRENLRQFKKSDYPEDPESTIFLLLDNQPIDILPEESGNVGYIHLSQKNNYYSLFYAVLKKLLPDENLDKYFLEFEKQCATLYIPIFLTKDSGEKQPCSLETPNTFASFFKEKYVWVFMAFFCVFILVCQIVHKKPEVEFLKCTNVSSSTSIKVEKFERAINWNLPRQDNMLLSDKTTLKNY